MQESGKIRVLPEDSGILARRGEARGALRRCQPPGEGEYFAGLLVGPALDLFRPAPALLAIVFRQQVEFLLHAFEHRFGDRFGQAQPFEAYSRDGDPQILIGLRAD